MTDSLRRPGFQFSLRTLFWLMAVVAAFFAGAVWQHEPRRPLSRGVGLAGDEVNTI